MQAVGLEGVAVQRDRFQQEGQQRDFFAFGDVAEGGMEVLGVLRPVIRRQAHADQQHSGFPPLRRLHHESQVVRHGGHRQAAQSVVGAEREDHDGRLEPVKRRGKARLPAGRGFAADAGVAHRVAGTSGLQALSEQGRPALADGDAETRGKAVAVDQDALFRRNHG